MKKEENCGVAQRPFSNKCCWDWDFSAWRKAERGALRAVLIKTFPSKPGIESKCINKVNLTDGTERFRASARSNWVSLKTRVIAIYWNSVVQRARACIWGPIAKILQEIPFSVGNDQWKLMWPYKQILLKWNAMEQGPAEMRSRHCFHISKGKNASPSQRSSRDVWGAQVWEKLPELP